MQTNRISLTALRGALILCLCLMLPRVASAQEGDTLSSFRPYWYLQPQIGVGIHTGETSIDDLISPAAQVAVGWQWSPIFGARIGVSGWEAKNRATHPRRSYEWNYVQTSLDATVSLVNLIGGWRDDRAVDVYAFLGAGWNVAFNNGDARRLAREVDRTAFRKLWGGTSHSLAVRGGLGLDVRLTSRVALSVEANTNFMSDRFNSKRGKHGNYDQQTHLLAGVKVRLGRSAESRPRTEVSTASDEPAPAVAVTHVCCCCGACRDSLHVCPLQESGKDTIVQNPVAAPAAVTPQPVESLSVNVFFVIGSAKIRESEAPRLRELLDYMKQNPEAAVRLHGYADRGTGNPDINMRISIRRAAAVRDWLTARGVEADRIATGAFGDTEQPFATPEENRVVICITHP